MLPATLDTTYCSGFPSKRRTAEGIVEKASMERINKNKIKKCTWSGV